MTRILRVDSAGATAPKPGYAKCPEHGWPVYRRIEFVAHGMIRTVLVCPECLEFSIERVEARNPAYPVKIRR